MNAYFRSKTGLRKAALLSAVALAVFAFEGVNPPKAVAQAPFFNSTPSPAASLFNANPAPQILMSEGIVATVDDEIITSFDLKQRILWLVLNTGIQPTAQNMPDLQRRALSDLMDERLQKHELLQQAKRREIDPSLLFVDDNMVDARLLQLAQLNNMSLDQFFSQLNRAGLTTRSVREQTRMMLSWQQWIQSFYGQRVRISEDQANAYLRELTASASKPRYQISEIFLPAYDAQSFQTATATANQIVNQLRTDGRFEPLAQQFSASPTAAKGGDAGWMFASQLPTEVVTVLDGMRAGEISAPIRVNGGIYIIGLREKAAGVGTVMLNLKQIAVDLPLTAQPDAAEAAQARLLAVKPQITDCASMDRIAQGAGLSVSELGSTSLDDLSPTFRDAVSNLQTGQVTNPIRTDVGLHLVAVCSRTASAADLPSLDRVKDELFSRELTGIERREMRNLRSAATITQPSQ